MTGPIYYGTTADGDEISFAAEKLITLRGQTGANEAEDVEVRMNMSSGGNIIVNAARGHFDIAADRTDLEGDVVITTTTGYRINSDLLITQMSTLDVQSPGPVQAIGPFGTLNAGAMTLNSGKEGASAQLVFTNGVKLIYDPKQAER